MDLMLRLSKPKVLTQPPLLSQLQQRPARWPGAPRGRPALTTVEAATRLISRQAHHRLRLLSLDRQAATFRWPLLRLAYLLAHQPEMQPPIRARAIVRAVLSSQAGRSLPDLLLFGALGSPQRNQAVTAAQAWGIGMPGAPRVVGSTITAFAPASLPVLARLAPVTQRPEDLNDGLPRIPSPISGPSGPAHSALVHDNRAALWRTGTIPFLPMQQAASDRQPIALPFPRRPLCLAVRNEAPRVPPTLFGRTEGLLFRHNRLVWPSPLSSPSAGGGSMALPAQQPITWLFPAHTPPVAQTWSTPARTLARQAQEQPARLSVAAPVSPLPRLPVKGPRLPSATQALGSAAYRQLGAEPSPGAQLRRLSTTVQIAPPPGAVPVSQPLPLAAAAVAPLSGNAEAVLMILPPRMASDAATARPPAGQRPPAQRLLRGSAVEPGLRTRLEKTVGFDLGAVRLHTDSGAAALAGYMHAQAFTVGSHIFFAAGRFQPQTQAGQALLLHELLHVRQQPGGLPLAAGALTGMQQRTLEQEVQTSTALLLRGAPSSSLGGSSGAVSAGQVNRAPSADPVLATPGGDSAFPRLHLAWPTHTLTVAPLRQEEGASRTGTAVAGTPGPTSPSAANAAPPVDLERLAQQVYTLIERRQRFEQERRGIQLWR